MRRKAVNALVMHTKDSIRHLRDDDDEMLRGQMSLPYIHIHCLCKSMSGNHLHLAASKCEVNSQWISTLCAVRWRVYY